MSIIKSHTAAACEQLSCVMTHLLISLFVLAAILSPLTNGFAIYGLVLSFYLMFNCPVWPVRLRAACN